VVFCTLTVVVGHHMEWYGDIATLALKAAAKFENTTIGEYDKR